jgi:3-isopropylmalate/(R)-2-methylmalate dehydratase small subunit
MSAHRVWRVGADVDTDQLAPGEFMKSGIDVIAGHCLQTLRPDFAAGVQGGDVLVAGPNFGIGSSREQAAAALRHLGLAAVIAPSFGGLFFRNAFNLGLLLLSCPRCETLAEGERIDFDARAARLVGASGEVFECKPVPGFLLDMVDSGGLLNLLKKRYPKDSASA